MENGNEPATKADLAHLRAEMNHQYDDLKETLRDSETRLLQAFYGYAESNRKRIGQVEAETAILASRMGTLEERLLEVEKRLNMPPQRTQ
jgi:chromosome segregation ATPase